MAVLPVWTIAQEEYGRKVCGTERKEIKRNCNPAK
jgi:hypothetical protein